MSILWRLFRLLGQKQGTQGGADATAGIPGIPNAIDADQARRAAQSEAQLRELRWKLADFALQQPPHALPSAWAETLRPVARTVKESGLRASRRDALEDERVAWLRTALAQGWNEPRTAGAAVAGMLLAYAYELPIPGPLRAVPDWLRADWVAYLVEKPDVFNRDGDAEAYAAHLMQVVARLHGEIETSGKDKVAWELADGFVKNPADVVKVNQRVTVTVLAVDVERGRISLSLKGGLAIPPGNQ